MCTLTGRQRDQYLGWISTLVVAVMLAGCDFSRVTVSCTEHIEAGDMGRFEDRGNGIVFDPQTQLNGIDALLASVTPNVGAWACLSGWLGQR